MLKNPTATALSRSGEETALWLFGPDIILPSQYYDYLARQSQLTPEKKLQLAVLESAVYDIQRYRTARSVREQRLFREAYAWFTAEDDKNPFSFLIICQTLELDPAYIRKGLLSSAHATRER